MQSGIVYYDRNGFFVLVKGGLKMQELKIKGIYKHYKGDLYLVEDVAYHSETQEKLVVYRALYGDNRLLVRP